MDSRGEKGSVDSHRAHDSVNSPHGGHDSVYRPEGHDSMYSPRGHDSVYSPGGHDSVFRPGGMTLWTTALGGMTLLPAMVNVTQYSALVSSSH